MDKDNIHEDILNLIKLGEEALTHEINLKSKIQGPSFTQFKANAEIILHRELSTHILYDSMINMLHGEEVNEVETFRELIHYFKLADKDIECQKKGKKGGKDNMNSKVFIVHGHDSKKRDEVEQLLRRIGLVPIILMNQPNSGLTIIEKLEKYSDVKYGIVLYSGCDQGKTKDSHVKYRLRARQNVVFEHGYLMSKLGRKNIAALVEKDVETPGDLYFKEIYTNYQV